MEFLKSALEDMYKEDANKEKIGETLVITEESEGSATKKHTTVLEEDEKETKQMFKSWFQNAYSQSTEVWSRIKRDMSEAAHTAIASDPLAAAERAASSVFRQVSEVAYQLHSGGEAAPLDSEKGTVDDEIEIEMPLPDVKTAFANIFSTIEKGFNNMLEIDDDDQNKTKLSGDNREARIEVLRADPRTFEEKPAMPIFKGVLPYDDWRKTHFDEEACSPLDSKSGTPAQVLEESSVVRRLIVQLVNPDGSGSLTDADFWSRYFYHVYVLDLGEERRRKIFAQHETSSPVKDIDQTSEDQITNLGSQVLLAVDIEKAKGISLTESIQPLNETSLERLAAISSITTSSASSVVVVDPEEVGLDNQDDIVDDEDHEETSGRADINDEWDEEFGDIQLSEEELKLAENEMKAVEVTVKTNQLNDTASEINDWETWS